MNPFKRDQDMSLQDINESLDYQPTQEDLDAYAQVLEQAEIIGDPDYVTYKLPNGDCLVVPFFECQGVDTIQHFTSEGLETARRVVTTRSGWYYAE